MIVKCDGFFSNCCPRNPYDGKKGNEEKKIFFEVSNVSSVSSIFANFLFHLLASSLSEPI